MGNSKALMLGAVTLIIGMYTMKIKEADRSVIEIGGSRFEDVQALELAKAGATLAKEELMGTLTGIGKKETVKSFMNGNVSYLNESLPGGQQRITSTATVGSQTRTVVVTLTQKAGGSLWSNGKGWKNWSRWEVTKTYVEPKKGNGKDKDKDKDKKD